MDIFPLHIFSTGILSDSIFICVWIGAMIVVFFNLRLGWNLSGLVVPGYLAPLIILKPWIAVSIFIDAIVTYIIVYTISEKIHHAKYWHNLFGRDYFFYIMLF